jgi:hypothetical protein
VKQSSSTTKKKETTPITAVLQVFTKEPKDVFCKVKVGKEWIASVKDFKEWPKDLLREWEQDLFYLFPKQFRSESYNAHDEVCLCGDIVVCPFKSKGTIENRQCSRYSRGICLEATVVHNEGNPLHFGTIGFFHGLSKQRVHQIFTDAQKKLITRIAQDPVLREFCESIASGKVKLPPAHELAAELAKELE